MSSKRRYRIPGRDVKMRDISAISVSALRHLNFTRRTARTEIPKVESNEQKKSSDNFFYNWYWLLRTFQDTSPKIYKGKIFQSWNQTVTQCLQPCTVKSHRWRMVILQGEGCGLMITTLTGNWYVVLSRYGGSTCSSWSKVLRDRHLN